ncbi:DUF3551 domain-containing protein [Bradyrhizobium sp. CCGB12]|uniref:DUF3551 domain-containing protein n=1 Tax=Bradyrhizobium sp. CCGB12 TaxID=2949632 RepID=UPI0020B3DAA9|nr:DUF3551 domain-containing protein [Bradyrhizobium sp. CCGB12]MCP3389592.1 DUF3551 domain-containing protein [Bradyrhizobium sp. CCGB12]
MRTTLVALLIFFGSSLAANAERDYPWCVFGGQLGYSGDCSYVTREQCLASASGRWNTYCDINPRVRFKQQIEPETKRSQQRQRQ